MVGEATTRRCPFCHAWTDRTDEQVCRACGRLSRQDLPPSQPRWPLTSYKVVLANGTVVGPIPPSTVVAMIKAGAIQPDHPVVDMGTGKAFFPDEDPIICFLAGVHGVPYPPRNPAADPVTAATEKPSHGLWNRLHRKRTRGN